MPKDMSIDKQDRARHAETKGARTIGLPFVVSDDHDGCKCQVKMTRDSHVLPDTTIMQRHLLAMLLVNPGMVSRCSEDWFEGANRRIFNQIRYLVDSRLPVTVSSLIAELPDREQTVLHSIMELNAGKGIVDFSDYNVGLVAENLRKEHFIHKSHECLISMNDGFLAHNDEEVFRCLGILNGLRSSLDQTEGFKYFGTDTDLPRPFTPLTIQGTPLFEAQNYYVIMGEEKSGKSHLISVLLHALIYGESPEFQIRSLLPQNSVILCIDTEQSCSDAQDTCRTAHLMAHQPYNAHCPNLYIASADGMSAEETVRNIEKSVRELHPAVVFIDGYAGLFEDNYQNKGAEAVMKKVRAIARDCNTTIIGIWHTVENAITGRTTAFGAAGKMSQKYGGGTLLVENRNGIISIRHHQSRRRKIKDIFMQLQTMVIVDDPEGCKALECEHGDVEALLASMGKSINDPDVHIFAVPRCVSPLDVDSIIKRQKETEKIEALRRKDRANEEDYRAQMLKIFGTSTDSPMTREEMRDRYTKYIWREGHGLTEAYAPCLSKTQLNSRSQAFKRLVDACLRLDIIAPAPDDGEKFHYIHKA